MTTSLSEILQGAEPQAGTLKVEVPDDWGQGRSIFGGLQVALAAKAIRSLVPESPLRCLQTNFIGPLASPVTVQAKILREGKNTTQVEAVLFGDSGLATQVMAVLGNARSSSVELRLPPPPTPSESPVVFPFLPGITPNFTQHFAMHLLHGHMPFSGTETTETIYRLDLKDQGLAKEGHLIALADVVPPLGLSYLRTPAFGSTLSWMLEFLGEVPTGLALSHWTLATKLLFAQGGYTNQTSTLFSPQGQAVALSRQSMMIFG